MMSYRGGRNAWSCSGKPRTFSGGANIGFMQVVKREHIRLRVYSVGQEKPRPAAAARVRRWR